jgi:hypothetical protein
MRSRVRSPALFVTRRALKFLGVRKASARRERSGTRFLLNALASCYAYAGDPWGNLDGPTFNLNCFYPPEVRLSGTGPGGGEPAACAGEKRPDGRSSRCPAL